MMTLTPQEREKKDRMMNRYIREMTPVEYQKWLFKKALYQLKNHFSDNNIRWAWGVDNYRENGSRDGKYIGRPDYITCVGFALCYSIRNQAKANFDIHKLLEKDKHYVRNLIEKIELFEPSK